MKLRFIRATVYLLSLLVLVLLFLTSPSSSSMQVQTEKLEFSIAAEKTGFIIGEPVRLSFRLRNASDKDVTADFNLSFDFGRLHVLISKDGTPFTLYVPKSLEIANRADRALQPITIKAGETIESFEFISFNVDTNDFAFPVPRSYQLKAIHFFNAQDFAKKVESNIIEISISEPTGVDIEALAFIRGNGLKQFLTPEARLFPHDVETIRKVQEFIERFPGSTYRPYAELALDALCQGRFDVPLCFPMPQRTPIEDPLR